MRIRTIKPEFWSHPVMAKMTDATKLLAIGLLNYADDEGFFHADAKLIRNAIRPFDDDSRIVHGAITELSKIGYISIVNHLTHGPIGKIESFAAHQVINRPKTSGIKALYDSVTNHGSISDDSLLEGKGREQGKERNDTPNGAPSGDGFEIPDSLQAVHGFTSEWASFKVHRRRKRAPMTKRAAELLLQKLAEKPDKALAAIQTAMTRGWTGFEWQWIEQDQQRNGKTQDGPQRSL